VLLKGQFRPVRKYSADHVTKIFNNAIHAIYRGKHLQKIQDPPNFDLTFDMVLQLLLFIVVLENERSQVVLRNNVI